MQAGDTIPALRVEGLSTSYGGGRRAIAGVDLEIRAGELVALVGTNGAGKTTLLKCVLDLMLPDAGRIEIFGVPNREPRSRKRVAYLPERFSPPHYLLGREFLEMTLSLGGGRFDRALALAQLAELELDAGVLERPARELSKGMTQKLGIAATLLAARELCIFDEPLEGLDAVARVVVKRAFAGLQRDGRTVLFTAHVLADAEEVCSSLVVLDRGAVRFRGTPAELCERYEEANLERAFVRCVRSPVDRAFRQARPER
jgi:ABC-2 type transport system ATP-binding protein